MKVTIIGAAGELGSTTAYTLATQGLVEEIVGIDLKENMLLSHLWDISTAASGNDTIVRAGKDEDMAGSGIIIVTAGAPQRTITSRMDMLNDNLSIILDIAKRIERFCPEAVIIITSAPVGPLNYAIHLSSGIERKKLIGYSLNDSIRFRILVAEALGARSSQVEGIVIGEHGDSQVQLFSSIRVNGKPIAASEDFKQDIRSKVPEYLRKHQALQSGRTSGWTSAVGLTAMIRAIVENTGEVIPCSAVLDGEYGYSKISMGVPTILDQGGIKRIIEYDLAPDEKELLEISAGVLHKATRHVEESLKKSG